MDSKQTPSSFDVPEIDKDTPLKMDQQEEEPSVVPETDIEAPLNIEKLTKDEKIPESDLNAPLRVEEEPQTKDSDSGGGNKLFIFGGIVVGLIILAIVGFIALQFRSTPLDEKEKVTTKEEPADVEAEEEKPTINRAEWMLEILNGSGVKGAAKELADKLEELGYKIIKTGNADRSNYKETEIFISKDFMDKSDLFLEDLKDEIEIATVSGELKDSTASARIIIGK